MGTLSMTPEKVLTQVDTGYFTPYARMVELVLCSMQLTQAAHDASHSSFGFSRNHPRKFHLPFTPIADLSACFVEALAIVSLSS